MFEKHSLFLVTVISSVACGDDGGTISLDDTSTGGGTFASTGVDEGGTGTTGSPVCDEYPQGALSYDAFRVNGGDAVLDLLGDIQDGCPAFTGGPEPPPMSTGPRFYVYRPDTGVIDNLGWPLHCVPLVVFSPPASGNPVAPNSQDVEVHTYPHIFDTLAQQGFLVVATYTEGTGMAQGGDATVEERANLIKCAVEWARDAYAGRLSDDLAIIGHSRGGAAVNVVTPDLLGDGLRAAIALAPTITSDEPLEAEAAEPIDPEHSTAYLVIQGNNDEDTTGVGIRNYDFMAVEDPSDNYAITDYEHDKAMLWAYDAPHFVWGGQPDDQLTTYGNCSTGNCPLSVTRGKAISGFYVPAFLSWKIYGQNALRDWFVAPTYYDADDTAFPDEVLTVGTVDVWEELYDQTRFSVLGERPVMLASFSQGVGAFTERRRVDTMSRPQALTCVASSQDQIFSPAEPSGAALTRVEFDDVCLAAPGEPELFDHDTFGMDLEWRAASQGDQIRWQLDESIIGDGGLTNYTSLSVRLGKVADTGSTVDPMELEFVLETEAVDSDTGDFVETVVSYDRLIDQTFAGQAVGDTADFMHTVRVPIADLDPGQDLEHPRSIALRVPDPLTMADSGSHLIADSLELAHHPADGNLLTPSPEAFWVCEAGAVLDAVETSCDTVPDLGVCPSGNVVTTSVSLPRVDDGGAGYDGWVVHTHAGLIGNAQSPTTAEIATIRARCVSACEREYEGEAHLSANCSAARAIENPVLFTHSESATRRAVPDAYRDGSGVWGTDTLSCDVLDDCCAEFDEDLCPAAPMRLTEASTQLGRGEEWVVSVTGTLKAKSLDEGNTGQAAMSGTIGYTTCADGNAAAPCPFYVGSLSLATTEDLTVNMTCNSVMTSQTVDAFAFDLAQPAMGIDAEANDIAGFPPGALVSDLHAELGTFSFDLRGLNEKAVDFRVDDDWIEVLPGGGFEIFFDLLCDGDIKPIKAWFLFDAASTLDSPPTVSINMASSVSCTTSVSLDATVTDPDLDAGVVRWLVDGVLLDDAVTSITVDESLDVEAIVRDARGAMATATHTISCT